MPAVSNKTNIGTEFEIFFIISLLLRYANASVIAVVVDVNHSPDDTTRQIERHSNVGRKLSRFNFVHHHFLFCFVQFFLEYACV